MGRAGRREIRGETVSRVYRYIHSTTYAVIATGLPCIYGIGAAGYEHSDSQLPVFRLPIDHAMVFDSSRIIRLSEIPPVMTEELSSCQCQAGLYEENI